MENKSLLVSVVNEDQLKSIVENAVRKIMLEIKEKESASQLDEYLTQGELAKLLKVSLSTINNWKLAGKLKFHKIGARVLFKREDVLAKIAEIRRFRSVEVQ